MAEEFARMVAQVTVMQVCESLGFSGVQRSALDSLTDILGRYIEGMGRSAHALAELSGRSEANLHDVMLALEDHGSSLADVSKFVDFVDETGPAQPVPSFPAPRKIRSTTPSFVQRGDDPPRSDIPDWLPTLPDKHTYQSTPVWDQRGKSELQAMVEEGKQRRKAEQSLVRLHTRMEALTAGGFQGGAGESLWGFLAETSPRLTGQSGQLGQQGRSGQLDQDSDKELKPQERASEEGTVGGGAARRGEAPVPTPAIMDGFSAVLGVASAKVAGLVKEASQAPKDDPDCRWSGWAVPVKHADVAAAAIHAGSHLSSGRVAFHLASPLRRRALAVRCKAAVRAADVLGRVDTVVEEKKDKVGKEDEHEEKRRKVEQMIRDAEDAAEAPGHAM